MAGAIIANFFTPSHATVQTASTEFVMMTEHTEMKNFRPGPLNLITEGTDHSPWLILALHSMQ